jgi:hypothetical protein
MPFPIQFTHLSDPSQQPVLSQTTPTDRNTKRNYTNKPHPKTSIYINIYSKMATQAQRHRIAAGPGGALHLAPETRNVIYTYALETYSDTELAMLPTLPSNPESPYHLHTRDPQHRALGYERGEWYEINQLKYACWQLYLETRTLGLGGRTRLFFSAVWNQPRVGFYEQYCPGPQCIRFMETSASSYVASVRRVVIVANKGVVVAQKERVEEPEPTCIKVPRVPNVARAPRSTSPRILVTGCARTRSWGSIGISGISRERRWRLLLRWGWCITIYG